MNAWTALGITFALILIITYLPVIIAKGNCPSNTYGKGNSTMIKYFSSPFCIACWTQKPILEELAGKHGDKFTIEEYDADFCKEHASPHALMGIPAYIVNGTVIYGAQTKESLQKMVGI